MDDRTAVTVDDGVADDFARMGLTVDRDEEQKDEAFEVWTENWPSVRAFLACETQWQAVANMNGLIWLGLRYEAVDVVLRRLQLPDTCFNDLMDMEGAALAVFSETDQ